MSYISELRKKVGSMPIIMSAAGVIIIDRYNRVLLQKRSDNMTWGLPGGALELGESLEEAATREVFEETGLTVDRLKIFGVFSGEDMYYKYPNGDEVYIVSTIYYTRHFKGEPRPDGIETLELEFFEANRFPLAINPPDLKFLRQITERITEIGW